MKYHVTNFNLDDTVTCGQIFRYEKEDDNSYTIILSDRVINVKYIKDTLYIDSNNMDNLECIVKKYFDLDYDYDTINKIFLNIDNNNYRIIDSCKGLKIINEPRLEVIVSYILSANNGVPQIKSALNNISKKFGSKVMFKDKEYYLFPTLEQLKNARIQDFRDCKAGFRDKYIYEIIQRIVNKEFIVDNIETMNSNDALNYLMSNKGIGEKVASCILLFGFHRLDVFPIDTWVKKYMKEKYDTDSIKDIRKIMSEKYKENCGLYIQYIFHYNRNKKI